MTDIDRAVGRIEGTLKAIVNDVQEIKKDVKSLKEWKWNLVGGATVASIVVGVVARLIFH